MPHTSVLPFLFVAHSPAHLDVREVLGHGPDCSVVGTWGVQGYDGAGSSLRMNQVQHSRGASITEVDGQVLGLRRVRHARTRGHVSHHAHKYLPRARAGRLYLASRHALVVDVEGHEWDQVL